MKAPEVEAVARALCKHAGGRPDRLFGSLLSWRLYMPEARVAITALDKHRAALDDARRKEP